MEDAFVYVLFGVVVVGVVVALAFALFSTEDAYSHIGRGGLRDGSDRPVSETAGAAEAPGVREAEIRQLLEAKNERRARRGQAPVDVEAEIAALERPAGVDPALAAEVRELVVARNARRLRRGQEPLDVEAEVQRRLQELG